MKKSEITPSGIDEYIAQFPKKVRSILVTIRKLIHKAAPMAAEAIKYQMPTFVLGENLVHFAAYEHHIGFYPTPSAIAAFEEELKAYKWAKGSVQFQLNEPIPYDLIEKMVLFRLEQVSNKFDLTIPSKPKRKKKVD